MPIDKCERSQRMQAWAGEKIVGAAKVHVHSRALVHSKVSENTCQDKAVGLLTKRACGRPEAEGRRKVYLGFMFAL